MVNNNNFKNTMSLTKGDLGRCLKILGEIKAWRPNHPDPDPLGAFLGSLKYFRVAEGFRSLPGTSKVISLVLLSTSISPQLPWRRGKGVKIEIKKCY